MPASSQGRDAESVSGRELEFIFRSLVDLRLQVEELRHRVDERGLRADLGEEVHPTIALPSSVTALEPPAPLPENVMTVKPGMRMADIERGAIEAVLRETGGNRRKAAELLGIGERTMYRKLRDYQIPDSYATLD